MLARDVVVRRAFEILAVAVIDKILVSWLVCGSERLQINPRKVRKYFTEGNIFEGGTKKYKENFRKTGDKTDG